MTWKTLNEVGVPDVVEFVRTASRDGRAVHVGTDSMQSGRHTHFVTVVVVLDPGKGGRVVYRRDVVPRIRSLRAQELVGLVVGQGFRALIKPESWAATHAADSMIRMNVA